MPQMEKICVFSAYSMYYELCFHHLLRNPVILKEIWNYYYKLMTFKDLISTQFVQ